MCGIVGLFAKKDNISANLGLHLSKMLESMSDRGPDSAGLAIYGKPLASKTKITVQSRSPEHDFQKLKKFLSAKKEISFSFKIHSTHAVIKLDVKQKDQVTNLINDSFPNLRILSVGKKMEIYKEIGKPAEVVKRFEIVKMKGSHGIGHTRMATESAVTTLGAHPFSTGEDQCLVHNGSLSNHNSLRRELIRKEMAFETENDSEVAASFITYRMNSGKTLKEALESALVELDGFYTFVVGTENGFGVLRDPIACKPAILAETPDYVAFGSEYRALTSLPKIEKAKVWEPEPATVYFWGH
ncbi:glutamine amidotransferase family protein [Paracoccaceae bacterium]|nr:glutamine amidotransferase family protein [Paracoccaceae bacterium]